MHRLDVTRVGNGWLGAAFRVPVAGVDYLLYPPALACGQVHLEIGWAREVTVLLCVMSAVGHSCIRIIGMLARRSIVLSSYSQSEVSFYIYVTTDKRVNKRSI